VIEENQESFSSKTMQEIQYQLESSSEKLARSLILMLQNRRKGISHFFGGLITNPEVAKQELLECSLQRQEYNIFTLKQELIPAAPLYNVLNQPTGWLSQWLWSFYSLFFTYKSRVLIQVEDLMSQNYLNLKNELAYLGITLHDDTKAELNPKGVMTAQIQDLQRALQVAPDKVQVRETIKITGDASVSQAGIFALKNTNPSPENFIEENTTNKIAI
jgi:hypothetical protein